MEKSLVNRLDLIEAFNNGRFRLRHFAAGVYPVFAGEAAALPVNRLFFPLENPDGEENFIADGSRKYILSPKKMYFIPAFYPANIRLNENLRFLSIQTNCDIFPGVELFSGCRGVAELPVPESRETLLRFCTEQKGDLFLRSIQAGALVFGLLSSMIDHYPEEDFWKPLALKRYLNLTWFLEKNGNARTSVGELALLCGESREHFTRHFVKCTGITPKQLIDRFVIGRILTLMGEHHSSKEIASLLLFSNEFVFSRYFKRNVGVSPRIWCRKLTAM